MLIAQISDCHIVDDGTLFADRVDSAAGLRAAVARIDGLDPAADLVVATGDLVNDGTRAQYDRLQSILAGLDVPLVPIPGNHDDRSELRGRFPDVLPAGGPDEPLDFVDDRWPVRIVALDTTIPGRHDGRLTEAQLAWLDERLSEAPDRPTIVVQHHPPVTSGIAWMDETCGFVGGGGEAEVIGRHAHVEAVLCGHLHRSFQRCFAGTIAVSCPSTASQLALSLDDSDPRYTDEPTGVLLHHWRADGGLVSHAVPIGSFTSWTPGWQVGAD